MTVEAHFLQCCIAMSESKICAMSCRADAFEYAMLLSPSKSLERQYLGSLVVHNLLGCQITLVANKKLVDILIGIPVNLIQPLLHVVEALLVCDVVHNLQNALG